jgi:UDP-N-acetylmuramoyl-tripeptide--D-alanyl-D-alanine ligase
MTEILSSLFFVLCLFFAWRRLPRYLHLLQQDDYNNARFLRWIAKSVSVDKKASIALFVAWLFMGWISASYHPLVENAVASVILAVFACFEANPRAVAKKKLSMTARAKRIFGASVLVAALALFGLWDAHNSLTFILWVQAMPLFLVAGNLVLIPLEARTQRRIVAEAKERLAEVAPTVVGITGSFGKTSVKHILGHILSLNAKSLFTPGSVNTVMGISRVIREDLRDHCRYFVAEMGAYGQGSIARLCRLTPPSVGIITSIGEAHYERFKSLDSVARAKFELAEAVIGKNGTMVVAESVLRLDYAKSFVEAHRKNFIVCGASDAADLKIINVETKADGLFVSVAWHGKDYNLFAPLFGAHHAGNIALAFATSALVGIEPEYAIAALRSVPQIAHRLEVKPQHDGTIFIDDAYNANPVGFVSGLELLSNLAKQKDGRSILVTPGIVELGAKHDEVHRELGAKAETYVDVLLAVCADRIPTFCEAFEKNKTKILERFADFPAARSWLSSNLRAGDVVLIENDLPDLYERKLDI